MEKSLTQFSDYELRNNKQSWSPITQRVNPLPQAKQNNSEWLSRMSQFIWSSINEKTNVVSLNPNKETLDKK